MSYGQLGDAAIPDRLACDYAPTGRASCKACGSVIGQDTVRIHEKVRSPWHDGFDTKYYHQRCGLRLGRCVHDFKGLQRLKWVDQLSLADSFMPGFSAKAPSTEQKRVERLNEMVWEVKAVLEKFPKAALKEVLELNGVYCSDKATPAGMLHGLVDGLVCGLLPACPWCGGQSLEMEGSLVRCYGYVSGSTHCAYRATVPPLGGQELFGSAATDKQAEPAVLQRTRALQMTPALTRALKSWKLPMDAPVRQLGSGGGGANSNGGGNGSSGGGGGGGAGGRGVAAATDDEPVDEPVDEPSADEEGVDAADTMLGMRFASIGTLRPPAAELKEIVTAHGGTWVEGAIGDGSIITHLIASEAEVRKPVGKRSAKYSAALEGGVPIVSAAYVLALAGELPEEDAQDEIGGEEAVPVPKRARGAADKGAGSSGDAIDVDALEEEPMEVVEDEREAKEEEEEEEEEEALASLKVAELRAMLSAKGLEVSGRKAALVQRLVDCRTAKRAKTGTGLAGGIVAASGVADGGASGGSKRRLPSNASAAAPKGEGIAATVPPAKPASRPAGPRPSGVLLRQRKHMAAYLLAGELGPKLPSVASGVREAAAREAAAPQPKPRVKLPTIMPGSALLTVDPEAAMGDASVYVDEYNLAYNVVLNDADLRTGVNKYYKARRA